MFRDDRQSRPRRGAPPAGAAEGERVFVACNDCNHAGCIDRGLPSAPRDPDTGRPGCTVAELTARGMRRPK